MSNIWRFHFIDDVRLQTIVCRFLLVSLNIDAILGEVTVGQRRKKLQETARGDGLSDAYTATVTRLKAQKGNKSVLGLKVLMWVLYSKRPLRTEELCHALAVEIGAVDLDPKNVPMLRTLLSSCMGLVTVEAPSSTVRLVHFTLQEHLLSTPTLFHNPHSAIAEVCLTYLNFGSVRDLPATLPSAPPTLPLLEYASCYWWKHMKTGVTENVKILALRLLDSFDEHISAQLLLLRHNENGGWGPYFHGWEGPSGFTGLHGVSFLGIEEMVVAVLEMKEWDINATDCMGSTALTWAARNGHEGVVKILLERADANPDKADTKYGRTPLSWAALNGRGVVVKVLLERRDVNPNQADAKDGRTPLWWAARNGHEAVVKMLLERKDVNPNQINIAGGWTPLWRAVDIAHEGVVRMLLEREDVNPNQADTVVGHTPLSWAANNVLEGIVKMLLERQDVDPDRPDARYGRTPLSWAAGKGREGVVRMLLQREGVNPDQVDTKYRRTPLAWAAWSGHGRVVKMLLERQDVRTTTLDCMNQTPLSLALSRGHDEVARILRDSINSHTADPRGQEFLSPSVDSGLSSSEPPWLPPLSSISPMKILYLLKKTNTHSNNTRPTLLLAPNRYFLIASLICLFAFLVYTLPSSFPRKFPPLK